MSVHLSSGGNRADPADWIAAINQFEAWTEATSRSPRH